MRSKEQRDKDDPKKEAAAAFAQEDPKAEEKKAFPPVISFFLISVELYPHLKLMSDINLPSPHNFSAPTKKDIP